MLLESMLTTALLMGIVSASSLPLGAIAAILWHPSDRSNALFMAFGGGALLAALTIDLVAGAVAKGYFYPLALGAIIGGLAFLGLNQIVNDYGGFLRKASTTIYHLRRKQYQQIRRITSRINRVDLFKDLPVRDFKAIAPSVKVVKVHQGESIYRKGDPADVFYIIAEGAVDLFNPHLEPQLVERLESYDIFGWRACLTSTPCAFTATAQGEVTLWSIPKRALETLLLNSPHFQQAVHLLLRGDTLSDYLREHHRMSDEAIERWTGAAVQSLIKRGVMPPAIEVSRNIQAFLSALDHIQRFALIQGLPADELQLLCQCLINKTYRRGETFYLQHTRADRMFFIAEGEVHLLDPAAPFRQACVLHANDSFGGLSMLTGARHSMTALAVENTRVWELRRVDLERLLVKMPVFAMRFRDFVAGEGRGYLQDHHLNADQSALWARKTLHSLDLGEALPQAADIVHEIKENKGAPLAIWLGITLDGIPESLVIGASLIHSHISLSLIAGLFLSNFPEALSSSVGMRQQGFAFFRILLMWSSLTLLTGLGAALGSQFFIHAAPDSFALVQGVAAGAMLTMIAATMLPEAYFKGGSAVGISTLMGFLVAIYFTTLQAH